MVPRKSKNLPPPPVRAHRLAVLGQPVPVAERADAAKNRAAILEAARKLLKKRSIREICMDELAETAGVGKGTLYRRFADRASLCHALLDDDARRLQAEVLRGFDLPRSTPWIDRLARVLDAIFDFTVENRELLSEAAAYERGELSRFDHPAHQWQRQEVAMLLSRSAAAGEIAESSPESTADFILAGLDPDLLRWHFAQGATKERLLADFRALWRHGVLGRAAPKKKSRAN